MAYITRKTVKNIKKKDFQIILEKYNESKNDIIAYNNGRILQYNITHLKFGQYFNNTVNNLPNSLIYLELSVLFNKSLDLLPESLQKLNIKKCILLNLNYEYVESCGFYNLLNNKLYNEMISKINKDKLNKNIINDLTMQ